MNRTANVLLFFLLVSALSLSSDLWADRALARSVEVDRVLQSNTYTPGDYRSSLVTDDGRSRSYILHIPHGYPASQPYALVLVFHGGLGTGDRARKATNFDAKADAKGFIVVYPDGIDHHWNDGRKNVNARIDDVGFVRQLIRQLTSQLPIDSSRIYAAGLSNGGHFALRLGCELSELLAGIGTDIGPMPAELMQVCKPARPVGLIGIQGAADPITPVGGGEVASSPMFGLGKGGKVESAERTMEFWASANGCDARPSMIHEPPRVNDGTSVDKYIYAGCRNGGPVVYYIVRGMGHSWPPQLGPVPQITGPTSNNINATDRIWDFFSTISR